MQADTHTHLPLNLTVTCYLICQSHVCVCAFSPFTAYALATPMMTMPYTWRVAVRVRVLPTLPYPTLPCNRADLEVIFFSHPHPLHNLRHLYPCILHGCPKWPDIDLSKQPPSLSLPFSPKLLTRLANPVLYVLTFFSLSLIGSSSYPCHSAVLLLWHLQCSRYKQGGGGVCLCAFVCMLPVTRVCVCVCVCVCVRECVNRKQGAKRVNIRFVDLLGARIPAAAAHPRPPRQSRKFDRKKKDTGLRAL